MMCQITRRALLLLLPLCSGAVIAGCGGGSGAEGQTITEIASDLCLCDGGEYVVDTDLEDVRGSITLQGGTLLRIEGATLTFQPENDLDYGIYLEDTARIVIADSTVTSNGKMYEIELRGASRMETTDSELLNHSAVKLFGTSSLLARGTTVEELRMDDQGQAELHDSVVYPNMQFPFSVEEPLIFPTAYENIEEFALQPSGAWSFSLFDSETQGWQVDVYPGTTITIQDSEDVNVGLRSSGSVNTTLNLTNPEGERQNRTITELGFDLTIQNSEIFFYNLYPKDNDVIHVIGETGKTQFLEIVLLGNAQLTVQDSHIFGQLLHINEDARFTARNCLIGSDDPEDPIASELGVFDGAIATVQDSNLENTDIVVSDSGSLTLINSTHDPDRVTVEDEGIFNVQ